VRSLLKASPQTGVETKSRRFARRGLRGFGKWFAAPAAVYLLFFTLYTWPWMPEFNRQFFANDEDGLQNVWNVWWVNHAVVHLHQSPWHTTLLHAPYGTTLLGQTMNPFNGFVAVVLLPFLSLVQTFNLLVIFSFVMGGVTAFWLCHELSKRYAPSIVGGFVFTFSAFHLVSAMGLMQLVSLEWIPLAVLLVYRLLTRPTVPAAIGASFSLLLILLCDYYYFLYALVLCALVAAFLFRRGAARASRPLLMFSVVSVALCAPLTVQLLYYDAHDKLLGAHDPRLFGADPVATLIDGGFWRFASVTQFYWSNVHGFLSATSIYVGTAVVVAFVVALIRRSALHPDTGFWLTCAAIFWALSLGPRLTAFGHTFGFPMPYAALARVIPPLKLGGTPYRLIVIVTLAGAVLTSFVLASIPTDRRWGRALFGLFCVVLIIDVWPSRLPTTPAAPPGYVVALASLPPGAVYDAAAPSESWPLYYQTIHHKPIALGYISRTPSSVERADQRIATDVAARRFQLLCTRDKIRYYTTLATKPIPPGFPVVYRDKQALIYDLETSRAC